MNPLDRLSACAGDWIGSSRLQDPATHAPEDSASTVSVTLLLEGRFVRLDYTWSYHDSPQEGSLLVGYDPKAERASAYWIDTFHLGHKVMLSDGTCSDDGEISVLGAYAAPPGPDWGWRTVLTPGDGDVLRLTMFNITPAGREELAVEARYERS